MLSQKVSDKQLQYDAILIGAGIMSATLALLMTEVLPEVNILILEKLESPAKESTGVFNNAGTGHAANCELNYTPMDHKGNINVEKALVINNSFERSLQLWASLYEEGKIDISKFLKFVPHISFVTGNENVEYLIKRHSILSKLPEFQDMELSNSYKEISSWAPLITKERDMGERISATRIKRGTDINFEALTNEYLSYIEAEKNVHIKFQTEVINLRRSGKDLWEIDFKENGLESSLVTKYIFLGAGGLTINLLQKSKIPESKLYGGFPVSGKWLVCDKPALTSQHNAKVYGKADIGSPPMSVPHLDTRWVDGKKFLLFGPFAGFTTKFLKESSYFDLFSSFKKENISSIFDVGLKNTDLIGYLFKQSVQNHNARMDTLMRIMPSANAKDWQLNNAGQRVQIIKKNKSGGVLKFGTELVNSADGSLSALLGASPGASTAVSIMLKVLESSIIFKEKGLQSDKNIYRIIFKDNFPEQPSNSNAIKSRNNNILGFQT